MSIHNKVSKYRNIDFNQINGKDEDELDKSEGKNKLLIKK